MEDGDLVARLEKSKYQTFYVPSVGAPTEPRINNTQLFASRGESILLGCRPVDAYGASVVHFQKVTIIVDFQVFILGCINLK